MLELIQRTQRQLTPPEGIKMQVLGITPVPVCSSFQHSNLNKFTLSTDIPEKAYKQFRQLQWSNSLTKNPQTKQNQSSELRDKPHSTWYYF